MKIKTYTQTFNKNGQIYDCLMIEGTKTVDLVMENSFGITAEENQVKTTFIVGIKDATTGWFEIDGGDDWYAEGCLDIEDGSKVVGYDGVFALADEIIELLERNGYNCEEVK